jgi:thiamine kinase-like enzyme
MSNHLIFSSQSKGYLMSILIAVERWLPAQTKDYFANLFNSPLGDTGLDLDNGIAGVQVTPLGGLTNKNLLITLLTEPHQKMVLKILAQDLNHYINRNHEALISRNLNVKGIGPPIIENMGSKYMLMDYFYGQEVTPAQCLGFETQKSEDGVLNQLVDMLTQIHFTKIPELDPQAAKFDTFLSNYPQIKRELIDLVNHEEGSPENQAYFLNLLEDLGQLVPRYNNFLGKQKEIIAGTEGPENVMVLCHNDVNTSNMIIIDGTGRLQLFDYEYAGYNYYYYEIANI